MSTPPTNRTPTDGFGGHRATTTLGTSVELEAKTKTYIEVNEFDLSKFISEYYGKPFRMAAFYDHLGQNTYWFETVEKDTEIESGVDGWPSAEEATKKIDAWLAKDHTQVRDWEFEREHGISVSLLMWDLCQKDVIPPGEYLILVWW